MLEVELADDIALLKSELVSTDQITLLDDLESLQSELRSLEYAKQYSLIVRRALTLRYVLHSHQHHRMSSQTSWVSVEAVKEVHSVSSQAFSRGSLSGFIALEQYTKQVQGACELDEGGSGTALVKCVQRIRSHAWRDIKNAVAAYAPAARTSR